MEKTEYPHPCLSIFTSATVGRTLVISCWANHTAKSRDLFFVGVISRNGQTNRRRPTSPRTSAVTQSDVGLRNQTLVLLPQDTPQRDPTRMVTAVREAQSHRHNLFEVLTVNLLEVLFTVNPFKVLTVNTGKASAVGSLDS